MRSVRCACLCLFVENGSFQLFCVELCFVKRLGVTCWQCKDKECYQGCCVVFLGYFHSVYQGGVCYFYYLLPALGKNAGILFNNVTVNRKIKLQFWGFIFFLQILRILRA